MGAQRRHRGERVAHDRDDAQAELVALRSKGDNAGGPRRVRMQPPAVDEAEQGVGVGEGEAGDVRRDLGVGGLVFELGRRVRRDADVGAPGVHRNEQAALGAGDDAELDLRSAVAGAEAQAGLRPLDDVESRRLGRLGRTGVVVRGGHRCPGAPSAPRFSRRG